MEDVPPTPTGWRKRWKEKPSVERLTLTEDEKMREYRIVGEDLGILCV